MTVPPQRIKTCCAEAYSSDAVALLLGESYHPGGAALTRRLADQLGLGPRRRRVADIACGRGATARLLAGDYDVVVDGVDFSEINVDHAENLPLPDNAFDALVCECSLCTFPDEYAAARQFAHPAPGWVSRHHRCHHHRRRPTGRADHTGGVGRLHR